ncbi:DEAD/DEAH box helicase [Paenibacillus xanthanilyticus]|uniref:SNF2 helicase associated domain-containing protein n=1 Tax=Paenibacillus xanthanilyticus TaxID=1783531 RepID=A0ABV8K266_9BACL
MAFQYTDDDVRLLCGRFAFEEGEAIRRAGGVTVLRFDPVEPFCEANVRTHKDWIVGVSLDRRGDIAASCSCPDFDPEDKYCEHVAAMMLHLLDEPDIPAEALRARGGTAGDAQLTSGILELFRHKPRATTGTALVVRDTREPVEAEFTCVIFSSGYRNYRIGLELKVGAGKRLYVVPDIGLFLDAIALRAVQQFSKSFAYDPARHRFKPEDDAVLTELRRIIANEALYREQSATAAATAKQRSKQSSRMVLVPPADWEIVLPLLASCESVVIDRDGEFSAGLQLSDEQPPIRFAFAEQEDAGFLLEAHGLDEVVVLPDYGMVLAEGKMHKLPLDACKQLAELKNMLDASRKRQVAIAPAHIEPFMEKVVPGLMKIGQVHVARSVTERIVQTPLVAKLYLDRIRDRLLAELEFVYGDIVFNPLAGLAEHPGEQQRILLRDGDKENQILDLMDQSGFVKTELGYFMHEEEAEYEFLHHVVPKLEKLLRVYATAAVKTRVFVPNAPPGIRAEVDERTDWLEFKFELTGISDGEIRNVLKAVVERRRYHRLPDGALLPLEGREYEDILRFMNDMGISKTELTRAQIRVPVARALHLTDSGEYGRAVTLGKSFRQLLAHIRNPDHLEFELPPSLDPILRDYQKYGFQWMRTLAHYRFGGILADDMGLGKTVQSIAYLLSMLPEIREHGQPALIIAPASLMYNWLSELNKFAPDIRALIADGTRAERGGKLGNLAGVDAVITSYPLIRRDLALYVGTAFHTVILDEAQFVKNFTTQTAQAVKSLQAKHRFALTGTPLENAVEELWSVFGAVFPDLFPTRKAFTELSRESVARRARPFLLRRLKTDVLKELPEKIESLHSSQLLPEQKKLYVSYLAKLRAETAKHLDDNRGFQQHRIKILAGITRLRQICCHPALFVEGYAGSSAKFEQLLAIVDECRSTGKRMLIFSQFTEMLGLIAKDLVKEGIPYFYLDGSTKASERVELCNRFNDGERDVFLASLKAGGTGLNLTGADTVVLYDLWWNPAVEQQAMDRAHRIGQTKIVQVIRLVSHGTVEDKMYDLQQRKRSLIDSIIQPGEEQLSALSEADIREILAIGAEERELEAEARP